MFNYWFITQCLQAAVQVACHKALTDPSPCSLAALCLALRRLDDNI